MACKPPFLYRDIEIDRERLIVSLFLYLFISIYIFMLKLCNKCNKKKSIKDFHNNPNTKDGRQGHCKSCHKSYYNKRKLVNGQIVYYVYYLPEHHYVGMTNNIDTRIYQHGQVHNRITEGYEIVGVYETAIEAHYVETSLHLMGYEGFRGF